jgi:hypothetical protein
MSAKALQPSGGMTRHEYLECEHKAEFRHDFVDELTVEMAGSSYAHTLIAPDFRSGLAHHGGERSRGEVKLVTGGLDKGSVVTGSRGGDAIR